MRKRAHRSLPDGARMSVRSGPSPGLRLGLLLALAGLLLLTGLGEAPLERAEIYFVDGARGMVERGAWLVPHYRGEPFFDKPPLTYWLIALSFEALGFSLQAARLPLALAALLALWATARLGGRLFDRETGQLGALLLATTPAFLSFGRMAMSDMLLTLASTLAFAGGCALAARDEALRSRSVWLGLALALGLGFLAKGPVAVLLPGLGLAWLAWRARARWRAVPPRHVALALLALAAVTLPWFALVQRRLGWGPLEHFFLRENLERFAGETYDSDRSPLYYLGVYLAEGLPWSLFAIPALLRLRSEARAGRPGASEAVLLLGWVALMLVPLGLSRGKIDYYLLPAYPALSLLLAWHLRGAWGRRERAWARTALGLAAAGLAVAPLASARLPAAFLPAPAAQALAHAAAWSLVATLLWCGLRPSTERAVAGLAAASAGAFLLVSGLYVPALRAAQPNAEIVADVLRERAYRPDARLAVCEDPTRVARDLLFEARVASVERCDLWAPAASAFPFLLLVAEEQRETLGAATRFVGEYAYVPATVSTLGRLAAGVEPDRLVLLANYPTPDPEADRRARKDRKRRVQERERRDGHDPGGPRVP